MVDILEGKSPNNLFSIKISPQTNGKKRTLDRIVIY